MARMRALRALRLPLDQSRGEFSTGLRRDGRVHQRLGKLAAVVEPARSVRRWRFAQVASLIPDREKPRPACRITEVRVREIEPANVDQSDDDSVTVTVGGAEFLVADRPGVG